MHKLLFLDTNIFMHYKQFDQVDWLAVAHADSAKIMFTPVNARELNTIKDTHPRSRLRKRAQAILIKISRLIDERSTAELRRNLEFEVTNREPSLDFVGNHLDPKVSDDNLIATILMYRQEMAGTEVALVTADEGIMLIAKARPHGIATIRMPADHKLEEEEDVETKRIRELEQKVRDLATSAPRLSLVFEEEDQYTTFAIPAPTPVPSQEAREKRLREIREQYPELREDQPDQNQGRMQPEAASKVFLAFLGSDSDELRRYNAALQPFYEEYASYAALAASYKNLMSRTIELAMWLANDGTAPADDIDVAMHFPDGLEILEQEDIPNPPRIPRPPKYMTVMERMAEQMSQAQRIGFPLHTLLPPSGPAHEPNVSPLKIRRTNSYEVKVHVLRVKHTLRVPFSVLTVRFNSYESASSFQIDYQISAANVPHKIQGQLRVVIKKDPT